MIYFEIRVQNLDDADAKKTCVSHLRKRMYNVHTYLTPVFARYDC